MSELDIHMLDNVCIYKGSLNFCLKDSKADVHDLKEVVNELHMDIMEHFNVDIFTANSYREDVHWSDVDELSLELDDLHKDKDMYFIPFYIVSDKMFDTKIQDAVEYYASTFEADEKELYHRVSTQAVYYRTTFNSSVPNIHHIETLSETFYNENDNSLSTVKRINTKRPISESSVFHIMDYTGLFTFSTDTIRGLNKLVEFIYVFSDTFEHYHDLIELDGVGVNELAEVITTNSTKEKGRVNSRFLLNYFDDIGVNYVGCGRNAAINMANQHAKPILEKYMYAYD